MDDLFDPPAPIQGSGRPPYQSDGARKEKLRERRYSVRSGGSSLPYAELRTASAFSFLDGASLPEDLVARAAELGLPAVALVDRNGVYGAPRFWKAAKDAGLKPLVGAEITLQEADLFCFEAREEAKGRDKSFQLGERQRNRNKKDFHLGGRRKAEHEGTGSGAAGGDGSGPDGSNDPLDDERRAEAPATRDPSFGLSPSMKAFRFSSSLASNRTASFFFDLSRATLLAESRVGYRNLCKLLTAAAAGKPKGAARATWDEVVAHAEGLHLLTGGDESPVARAIDGGDPDGARALIERWAHAFPGRVHVELQRHGRRDEERRNRALVDLARRLRLPLVATNGVRFAGAGDKPLFDVLTAIRCHTPLDAAGSLLAPNRERHLRGAAEMAKRFADLPAAVTHAFELSQRLAFTLDDLGYRFPDFPLPPGETPSSYLRALTWNAARSRFRPLSAKAQSQIQRELDLIAKLDLAGYFLIVADLVDFCRREKILCQGRGSAANSAVCYALGITAVDPVKMELLFERFLSEERGEWPDIDLDLPSGDQREKVIQYVYRKYGGGHLKEGAAAARDGAETSVHQVDGGAGVGAAMTANVITYRDRSAAREVGKALGFSAEQIDQLAKQLGSFRYDLERGDEKSFQKEMRAAGFDPDERRLRLFGEYWRRIQNLPRHLGQHSGGMVIAAGRLDEVVPLEPAAMPGRVVVQWDKDDCADLGLIKIDLLGLGMLNALEQVIPIVRERERVELDLAHLPADDPDVYAMLRAADTVGVFQVESRAQMASLPRNAPTRFYDLVIQVAIIRPGPITGGMVHPFFERRMGREEVTYFHPCLEPILKRTLGVPIFQEQLLRMAMAVSGFSGGEAEGLRRAMGFKRSVERMSTIEQRLRAGMTAKGIVGENQDKIVQSITSFALYGFPESHAASFALIAYASSYLKCHHPTAFLIGLLNAWPMGFYHPATLVKDAERHGVTVLPIDVNFSRVECTWEDPKDESVSKQGERQSEKPSLKGKTKPEPTSSSKDEPPAFSSRRPAGTPYENPVRKAEDGPSTAPLDGAQDHPRPRAGGQQAQGSRAPASAGDTPAPRQHARGACRLGLRYVDGFKRATAERIVEERDRGGPYRDVDDLARRARLRGEELERLSSIGALASLGLSRRAALWQAARAARPVGELFAHTGDSLGAPSPLPEMTAYERTVADFEGTGMTTGAHPMTYWRARLDGQGVLPTAELPRRPPGERARIAGAVIVRQRPGTAKGTLFLTLEDETGMAQAIVSAPMLQANRATILGNSGLVIEGKVVARDGSVSLRAERLWPLPELDLPDGMSHDFR